MPILSNSKKDNEERVAIALSSTAVCIFFFNVNHEMNNKGFAIHEIPAPPENIANQPNRNAIIESPHCDVVQ